MTWDEFFNSSMGIAVVPAVISAFFSLLGVLISLVCSERKTQKGMEQALKIYESELTRKVYASSKRLDMEFDIFHNMSSHCGNILKSMQGIASVMDAIPLIIFMLICDPIKTKLWQLYEPTLFLCK